MPTIHQEVYKPDGPNESDTVPTGLSVSAAKRQAKRIFEQNNNVIETEVRDDNDERMFFASRK